MRRVWDDDNVNINREVELFLMPLFAAGAFLIPTLITRPHSQGSRRLRFQEFANARLGS